MSSTFKAGDGAQSSTGSFSTSSGAVLSFASGDFDLNSGASLDGVRIDAHVTIAGDVNVHASGANALTGTLGGSGTLTVDGSLDWTGGSMIGSGTTVIASTGTLSIESGAVGLGYNFFDGTTSPRILDNQGTATWTSGYIYAVQDSLLENAGTFNAQSETRLLRLGRRRDATGHP